MLNKIDQIERNQSLCAKGGQAPLDSAIQQLTLGRIETGYCDPIQTFVSPSLVVPTLMRNAPSANLPNTKYMSDGTL